MPEHKEPPRRENFLKGVSEELLEGFVSDLLYLMEYEGIASGSTSNAVL